MSDCVAEAPSPSVGSDSGVAPQSDPLGFPLLIEGWRSIPHSYSLVNAWQCASMLDLGINLRFRETARIRQVDKPVTGIVPFEDRIASIPRPAGEKFGAVYRISYPYDFGPSAFPLTAVFATCERMIVRKDQWVQGTHGLSFGETLERNNVHVITPSDWSRNGFVRSGANPRRVHVVPHGVDTAMFKPAEDKDAVRKALEWDGKFVFLHVSACTGNKNLGGLFRAFANVVRKHPHARLVIKGLNGIYASMHWVKNELAFLSPAMKKVVVDNMVFTGDPLPSSEMARLYQGADAYVAPYQSEGFNIPVLEAMACGLPIIATAGGATDEFAGDYVGLRVPSVLGDHQYNGELWLKTHPDDIEAAMTKMIVNDKARSVSGRNAVDAAQWYSWKLVTGLLIEQLKGLHAAA